MVTRERLITRLNSLAVWVIGIGCAILGLVLVRQGLEYHPGDWVVATVFPLFAALILSRKPGHLIGMLMLLGGLGSMFGIAGSAYARFALDAGRPDLPLVDIAAHISAVGWIPIVFITLPYTLQLFPTARPISRRWRLALIPSALAALTLLVMVSRLWSLTAAQNRDGPQIESPLVPLLGPVVLTGMALGYLLALAALVLRFRRSHGVERQQMKWFVYASVLTVATLLWQELGGKILPAPFREEWIVWAVGLAAVLWAASIAIAIVRHRLFDIDVIIRKTLQWTVVTVLLGAVYVFSVLGLQEIFKRLTGQTSEIAVALSTLALAVAFMPIRRAAQNLIDKRFYRKRYNAQQVVEAYAESIKDEVDVNVIHQKMLTVLGETLQPKKITLFLVRQAKGEGGIGAGGARAEAGGLGIPTRA